MVRNRRGLAPWSLAREAGIESATVDGTIEVPQYVQPTLDTGFVDEKGDWKGVKSNDEVFGFRQRDEEIANGASFVTAAVNLAGFKSVFFAINGTTGGNHAFEAVMGPDTTSFYGLSPVNAGAVLRWAGQSRTDQAAFENVFNDSSETLTINVWNIYKFIERVSDYENFQLKITNNSGNSNVSYETAFMRLV